jgi:desulfoferrodoxin (superoxide reductase-like protein)
MDKTHYISFLAFVTADRVQFVKLYPEQSAEARFHLSGRGVLYALCNRHGLFTKKI